MQPSYPFVAIVGQQEMKLALVLVVINPALGGVLIRGQKGTGKSTAVRALAEILPEIEVVEGCPFNLGPWEVDEQWCGQCPVGGCGWPEDVQASRRRVRVVELPVGASEDRVVGTLDVERALTQGKKRLEPGLMAAAHRGILYVDEVNLLDDHVVDCLLDAAAMGICTVEREGVSFSHPARFALVGTMNPEEGELRPQLLDRFGLCVQVKALEELEARVELMARRAEYESDPQAFCRRYQPDSRALAQRIVRARQLLPKVMASREVMEEVARICLEAGVDGHRADIVTLRAACTIAAYEGRTEVMAEDVARAGALALPHRRRRHPLEELPGPEHWGTAGSG